MTQKPEEIATPACGLVRNDSMFKQKRARFHTALFFYAFYLTGDALLRVTSW